MSYILDALRRADAERERGEVPGLHTQQFGVLPGDDEAPRKPKLLITAIVVLALALAGVLAWNFFGSDAPPKTIGVVQAPMPPIPPPPRQAAVAPLQPLPASPAIALPAPVATPASAAREAIARRALAKPPVRRDDADATPPVAASDRIYTQAELPEAIRRNLPKIAFGGASYSGDKASRMVILNGQVFHEGDTIAPGLVLKQVQQKGAVLAYKGYRYEIGF